MSGTRSIRRMRNFYPRPPRGGRLERLDNMIELQQFLSTPSARRATPFNICIDKRREISIHALREEGDLTVLAFEIDEIEFLSTPSARRAT